MPLATGLPTHFPLPLWCLTNGERTEEVYNFPSVILGGSMEAACYKAAAYCFLPDVKSMGVRFASTLCETQKQAP